MNALLPLPDRHSSRPQRLGASTIGALATHCLALEVRTWPKPGLVSPIDSGSHDDMDADLLLRSASVLQPFFTAVAAAGADAARMDQLRAIGIAAEAAMLAATRGVNTHRGAIFGLGLLSAAAGRRHIAGHDADETIGDIVRKQWAAAIRAEPIALPSHGATAGRRYGVSGARGEAASGFRSVYDIGVPALRDGRRLAGGHEGTARVQAIFALIAHLDDTNLLHRGGRDGLAFAQNEARRFLDEGGVGTPDWQERASATHAAFVARRLSPGGAADLLAMTLFVAALDAAK